MSEQNISNCHDCKKETTLFKKAIKYRSVILSAIAAIAAIYAMIFATTAWLAQNKTVHSSNMEMGLNTTGEYELATAGSFTSPYSAPGGPLESYAGKQGVAYISDEKTLYKSTHSQPYLEWQLTNESNMRYLQPGSQGKLTYYIIPPDTATEDKTFEIQLKIEGFNAAAEQAADDTDAMRLLNGHILFFTDYQGGIYSGWLQDEIQRVTVNGNQLKEVTLYWVWPFLYGNLTHFDGSSVSPICSTDGPDYKALLQDMEAHADHYFFYNDQTNSDGNSDSDAKNDAYNNADELIGEHISYILLKANMR